MFTNPDFCVQRILNLVVCCRSSSRSLWGALVLVDYSIENTQVALVAIHIVSISSI